MEETKSFYDLAREQGGTIEPWNPSEEFMRDFCEYMEESIKQSRINLQKAIESSKKIIIF